MGKMGWKGGGGVNRGCQPSETALHDPVGVEASPYTVQSYRMAKPRVNPDTRDKPRVCTSPGVGPWRISQPETLARVAGQPPGNPPKEDPGAKCNQTETFCTRRVLCLSSLRHRSRGVDWAASSEARASLSQLCLPQAAWEPSGLRGLTQDPYHIPLMAYHGEIWG